MRQLMILALCSLLSGVARGADCVSCGGVGCTLCVESVDYGVDIAEHCVRYKHWCAHKTKESITHTIKVPRLEHETKSSSEKRCVSVPVCEQEKSIREDEYPSHVTRAVHVPVNYVAVKRECVVDACGRCCVRETETPEFVCETISYVKPARRGVRTCLETINCHYESKKVDCPRECVECEVREKDVAVSTDVLKWSWTGADRCVRVPCAALTKKPQVRVVSVPCVSLPVFSESCVEHRQCGPSGGVQSCPIVVPAALGQPPVPAALELPKRAPPESLPAPAKPSQQTPAPPSAPEPNSK